MNIMKHIPLIAGIMIVAFMFAQHITITNPDRNREQFYKAWKNYRKQILFCRFVTVTGILFIVTVLLEFVYKVEDPPITSGFTELVSTREYITLIFLTFFLSVLKFLIEDQVEKRIREGNPAITTVWLRDVWLLWFCASVLISIVLGKSELLDASTLKEYDLITAVTTVLLVTLTYDFWIYNVLHRQLTEGDGFLASSVSQIYGAPTIHPFKEFRGFLTRAIQYQPPAQILVIGPKGAGKTHWIAQHDAAFAAKVRATGTEDRGVLSTEEVQFATTIESIPIEKQGKIVDEGFSLSFIDFPGENIGDHCTLPFELRSDVLVLLLSESALNPQLDERDGKFMVHRSEDISDCFGSEEQATKERDYMYALYFGLKIDDTAPQFAGRQAFGVGSFVLIVNSRSHDTELQYGDRFKTQMRGLAVQLGKKFGVKDEERSFFHYYNIDGDQGSIIRQAIGSLHNTRPNSSQ